MPTLIVETGEIVPNANTYVSLDEAASYHTRMGNEWESSSDEETYKQALIIAARSLDTLWGGQYKSYISDNDQPLLFPRITFVDNTGRKIKNGTIPRVLREAQCEIALMVISGLDVLPSPQTGSIKSESVTVDVISKSTTYGSQKSVSRYAGMEKIELILAPILSQPTANWTIKV